MHIEAFAGRQNVSSAKISSSSNDR